MNRRKILIRKPVWIELSFDSTYIWFALLYGSVGKYFKVGFLWLTLTIQKGEK